MVSLHLLDVTGLPIPVETGFGRVLQAIKKTAARAPAKFVVFIGKLLKSFDLGDIGPWSYALVRERFPDQLHENFVVERFREEGKGSCFDGGLARHRIIAPGEEDYLCCG